MSEGIDISSLEDARLDPYRKLKERELAREGGRFIAEGEMVVRRLLESDFAVDSVLLARRRVAEMGGLVPAGVAVYVVADELIHEVVGFKFHSGVLACGRRRADVSLEGLMSKLGGRVMLVICPEIANTENLGSLVRIAAGFGADGMVLGERCCDPFFRQAIRVSMGNVFSLPIVRSQCLLEDLAALRGRWQVPLVATVLADDARPLHTAPRLERVGILLGNEAQGLSPADVAACDYRVTIPMKLGTDSLNVSIAAAVTMYHYTWGD